MIPGSNGHSEGDQHVVAPSKRVMSPTREPGRSPEIVQEQKKMRGEPEQEPYTPRANENHVESDHESIATPCKSLEGVFHAAATPATQKTTLSMPTTGGDVP